MIAQPSVVFRSAVVERIQNRLASEPNSDERFLREERVAVIPGSAFGPGGEGFVRACYAASMKDISEAITRMDNFLTNLRRSQGRG